MDIAGKTGTAQVKRFSADKLKQKCETLPFGDRDNALFAAFAPSDNPTIAVAVVAEHGCHGSSGAAPVALAVVKAYLEKYMPERYSPQAIKERLKTGKLAVGKVARLPAPSPTEEEQEDSVRINEAEDAPAGAPSDE
jgi:penicillin-binding protein 2